MFYIGVSHYYATGEGVVIYVASGSEKEIRSAIPEYFHQGLTILTPAEWIKAKVMECESEYHKLGVEVLQTYLPVLWSQIEERALGRGCNLDFYMKYNFNCA
ncbi:conserved hypothetical protein [Vibrio crassostreae]|nr:conserved hypothetical protein [Vibrio crassostreae]CAK3778992.1 conserved hypothetical protein [Vibrio crassostreae]